jgi:hypothetical protein
MPPHTTPSRVLTFFVRSVAGKDIDGREAKAATHAGTTLEAFKADLQALQRKAKAADYKYPTVSQGDVNSLYAAMCRHADFTALPSAGAMRVSRFVHEGITTRGGRGSMESALRMRDKGSSAAQIIDALQES